MLFVDGTDGPAVLVRREDKHTPKTLEGGNPFLRVHSGRLVSHGHIHSEEPHGYPWPMRLGGLEEQIQKEEAKHADMQRESLGLKRSRCTSYCKGAPAL